MRPKWRHNDGANFAFIDGHAKWHAKNSAIYPQPPNGVTNPDAADYQDRYWDLY